MSKNAIETPPHTLNNPGRATQVIFDRETGVIHGAHYIIIGHASHNPAPEVQGQSVRDAILRRAAAAAGLPTERLELMPVSDLAPTDLAAPHATVQCYAA